LLECIACGKKIHDSEPVSAAFGQEGQRNFFHPHCEDHADHLTKWKEEAAWAFRPVRLTIPDWSKCSPRKHLGVWQSMFIARRDEDIWCPDCGLKLAKHEGIRCSKCGGGAIITGVETTQMVFTHRERLFKLLIHCTERGEDSSTYAISSGFTPVAVTSKKKQEVTAEKREARMLEYQPREDVRRGLRV
jgi:DNA-directed RNA polymerase subunit RPC12/RpoP